MIENIVLKAASEIHANVQTMASMQVQRTPSQEANVARSSRSSLRQFKAVLEPSKSIQDTLEYLGLEKQADSDWADGFQLNEDDWNYQYRKWSFFKSIADRYAEASSKAIELSQLHDAIRIMEKHALVYAEKLDMLPSAFELLLNARTLCQQIGDLEKAQLLLQKLHALTDQEIASCRTEHSTSSDWEATDLILPLLRKAELWEVTGFPLDAKPLYEEAGHLLLLLDEEGTAFNQLSPALVAGLCFEKSDKTQDLARCSYEKVFEMEKQVRALYEEEIAGLSKNEKMEKELYKLIYFSPVCLNVYLASLKCGRTDLFADMMKCQVQQYISFLQFLPDDWKEDQQFQACAEYMKALIKAGETVLGPDAGALSEIKIAMEQVIDFEPEEQIRLWGQQAENSLLAIWTAPVETSAKEMVERLNYRQRFLGP